jgi:hypothetical protein
MTERNNSQGNESLECDHDWKWKSDWYGDSNVIGGTADCSGWECTKCGSTDNDDPKPEYDDDPDEWYDRE